MTKILHAVTTAFCRIYLKPPWEAMADAFPSSPMLPSLRKKVSALFFAMQGTRCYIYVTKKFAFLYIH